jgi:hypothetical protein
MLTIDITKALKEIQTKTHAEIEEAAAISWAERACASYYMVSHAGVSPGEALRHLIEAEDSFAEGLEHASKKEDMGSFVHQIQVAVKPYQDNAMKAINDHLLKTSVP